MHLKLYVLCHRYLDYTEMRLNSLKRKCLHFDEIFITGCTESCQNDNFQCSQWWKFHQNDDIFVSVIYGPWCWLLSHACRQWNCSKLAMEGVKFKKCAPNVCVTNAPMYPTWYGGVYTYFLSAVMLINMDNIVIITRKYVRFNIISKSASIGFWKYFRQPSVFPAPIKWHLWCLKRLRLGKYHQAAIVTNFLF